jgi:hypothetical protein
MNKLKFLSFTILTSYLWLNSAANAIENNQLQENLNAMTETMFKETRFERNTAIQSLLNGYQVIFVPGIWTGIYPYYVNLLRSSGFTIPSETLTSFAEHIEFLKKLNIKAQLAPINTAATGAVRAQELLTTIKASLEPVILITHSSGGFDVLRAIVSDPELMKLKVKGFLSMQTPFQGTPMTEWPLSPSIFGWSQRLLIEKVLGGSAGIEELSREHSLNFLNLHQNTIENFLNEIDFLSLGTVRSVPVSDSYLPVTTLIPVLNSGSPLSGLMDGFVPWIEKHPHGGPNDGLVPAISGCLPFREESCLIIPNMDHAGTVMDLKPFYSTGKENRLFLTEALIRLMMK